MLRKIIIAGLLSLYSFTFTFAQTSTAKWQTQPLIIDGNESDWGAMPRFFNAESNIKYEFRNDAQNLFIIIKAADRATQMQQILADFSVKIKLRNSAALRMGINFPAKKKAEMPSISIGNRTDILVDKSLTKPDVQIKDTAILDGFLFTNGIITSEVKNDKSICFARSTSNRESGTYEIRIPLRELFGDNFTLDNIISTTLQLQVSLNEISQKQASKMRNGMHSGGEHGMRNGGMRNGGEMGGGMLGGGEMGRMSEGEMGGNDMQQGGMRGQFSMESKSFNKDFVLSNGK
jgi:hypothetical protein